MTENEKDAAVKSVFKGGQSTTTRQEFTHKWVELIRALEQAERGGPA